MNSDELECAQMCPDEPSCTRLNLNESGKTWMNLDVPR